MTRSVTADGNYLLTIKQSPPNKVYSVTWNPRTGMILEDNDGRNEPPANPTSIFRRLVRHNFDGTLDGYYYDPIEKVESYLKPNGASYRRIYQKQRGPNYLKLLRVERVPDADLSILYREKPKKESKE